MAGTSKSFPFPPDLLAIAEALEQCESDARSLVSGLTDEEANWRPDGRSWSIGQCLDHLARTNAVYTAAMADAVATAKRKLAAGDGRWERKGPIRPGWLAAWFIRQLEPPVKLRVGASSKVMPLERFAAVEVLESYLRSHEPVRALLREARQLDLNRLRFRSPLAPLIRWSVATGLLVIPAHDRRHIWQMKQIRTNRLFPAAGGGQPE